MSIYVYIDGVVKGPFSKTEVFAMLAKESLTLQDSTCIEGDAEWATADEVLKRSAGGLFSVGRIVEGCPEIRPVARVATAGKCMHQTDPQG